MLPRFSRFLLLACVLSLARAAAALAGAEKEFPEFNFAVTLPQGWIDGSHDFLKPGMCANFGAADRTRMFLVLRSDNNPPPGELDDAFVTQYEINTEKTGGGKRLSGKFVLVQGIKSYERIGNPVVEGKKISVLSRTIPIQGHFYTLQGFRWDGGDAAEDPDIHAAMESFRFLTPPPLVPALSKRDLEFREAFQRGQSVGNGFRNLLIAAAVVGGIVFLLKRSERAHKRRRRPSRMPPLPPPMPPPMPPPLPSDAPTGASPPPVGPPPLPNQAPPRSAVIRPRQWRPRD
jgi:hypothetical protein